MAAEASVALMHRITNVRLPGPLPGDGDQRYAIDLDEQGLICRIEVMGTEAQQEEQQETQETVANWNGDWISPCLLYTSPSPRDISGSRMPSSA